MTAEDMRTAASKIEFDFHRITLGNILTLLGGAVFALGMVATASVWAASINIRLDQIQGDMRDVRCSLANAGISPTASACTVTANRR